MGVGESQREPESARQRAIERARESKRKPERDPKKARVITNTHIIFR